MCQEVASTQQAIPIHVQETEGESYRIGPGLMLYAGLFETAAIFSMSQAAKESNLGFWDIVKNAIVDFLTQYKRSESL